MIKQILQKLEILKVHWGNKIGIKLNREPIETLGVKIYGNEEDYYINNFKNKIDKLKNTLHLWKQRNLSLKQKIIIINNLLLPPISYLTNIINTPSIVINEIKKLILEFLWGGGSPKIKHDLLIQNIEDGGLKLINLE